MESSKATQEINKARVHLLKAKREISKYAYEGQTSDLIQINRMIDRLELLATSANAHSTDVEGVDVKGYDHATQLLDRSKFK